MLQTLVMILCIKNVYKYNKTILSFFQWIFHLLSSFNTQSLTQNLKKKRRKNGTAKSYNVFIDFSFLSKCEIKRIIYKNIFDKQPYMHVSRVVNMLKFTLLFQWNTEVYINYSALSIWEYHYSVYMKIKLFIIVSDSENSFWK